MPRSEDEPMLSVREIAKTLGGRTVLRGVSLEVKPGEVVLVCGRNGSGKSTLLSIVAGRMLADGGELLWCGQPLKHRHAGEIGLVAHDALMHVGLSVRDNLEWQAHMLGLSDVQGRVTECLKRFDLLQCATLAVGKLSFGQSRRAALCRALLGHPRLLLLDEPLDGLDATGRAVVLETLMRHRTEGGAALVITHEPQDFSTITPRLLELRDGRMVVLQPA